MRPLLQPMPSLRRLWLEQLQLPFPSRWYNASSSTEQLGALEEVVVGCNRESRMVPLALVNLVNMLRSRCRLELQGLIEVDDAPGSVLCSQVTMGGGLSYRDNLMFSEPRWGTYLAP